MLKRYRRAAGLTQEQLAERAGYSVGHISKLESSVRHPVPATVDLLADVLTLTEAERSALQRAADCPVSLRQETLGPSAQQVMPLVDRAPVLQRIRHHLTDATSMLLLVGEPGIGITRLLIEAAERGASEGWYVLEGSCRRTNNSPYEPLLSALSAAARCLEPAQLRVALKGCSWLVRLLPELAESGAAPMPAWQLPAEEERRLMFDAAERFLQHLAGPAGTLLALGNLQWAQPDTVRLLSALMLNRPRSLLKVIAGCHASALHPRTPLAALVSDLADAGLVAVEEVGPLLPEDAASLLARVLESSEVSEDLRAEAMRKSGGVPFAIVSYGRWLREGKGGRHDASDELGVPWDLAHVVRQRVSALPEVAQVLVQIAAITEGDDDQALLSAVAQRLGHQEAEVVRGLDAACEAGILVARGSQTYGFASAFTEEVVEKQLGDAQRAYLHRMVSEVLAEEGIGFHPEALAEHYLVAGELSAAIPYLERAGMRASALHAYATAEQCYRALAEQCERENAIEAAARAHEQLGTVLAQQDHYDEALRELDTAVAEYRAVGNRDSTGRAVARMGWVYRLAGDVERGVARLEREAADARALTDRGRATLFAALAQLHFAAGHYERELACAEQAADLARKTQNAPLLAGAEMERSTALDMLGQLDASLRVLQEAAIPVSGEAGDLWTQALALERAAHDHLARGDFDTARHCVARGVALAQQLDDTYLAAVMLHTRGVLRYYVGTWRRARSDLVRAELALRASSMPARAARAAAWVGRVELTCGQQDWGLNNLRIGSELAEHIGDVETQVLTRCTLAERALVLGNSEEAFGLLQPLLSRSRFREADLTEVLLLLGWAYVDLDDRQEGTALIASGLIRARTQGLRRIVVDALRIRALADMREGRWDDAWSGSSAALTLSRELPAPYAEAKVLYLQGQLLAARGELGGAGEQYAGARRILERLGERLYAPHVERAIAELDAARA
jgi:transcriptional regulator with XRE-family HTH domain/tetratricopeptide (TPR) repeat protein